jgi:hypothetical protein
MAGTYRVWIRWWGGWTAGRGSWRTGQGREAAGDLSFERRGKRKAGAGADADEDAVRRQRQVDTLNALLGGGGGGRRKEAADGDADEDDYDAALVETGVLERSRCLSVSAPLRMCALSAHRARGGWPGRRRRLKELDDDSDDEGGGGGGGAAGGSAKAKPPKDVRLLQARDIVGQEDGGVAEDDGNRIEPFNMNEELEEG